MPFVLTDKKQQFRFNYRNGVKLTFRTFKRDKDDNEADRFEKELAKIRGTKNFDDKFDKLLTQVAKRLLVDWEGVVDEDGHTIAFSPEAAAQFIDHHESRKYWYRPLSEYLYPPKEEEESELPEGEEPNF